jgi:hypothetical protein
MAEKKLFDCTKCVAWCCTYPNIPVTKTDIKRLAKHHGVTVEVARRKFTKKGTDGESEAVLRHQPDPTHFDTACMFLDLETRRCTNYEGRPQICRDFPTQRRCGYYEFLKFERENNDDPEWVAVT